MTDKPITEVGPDFDLDRALSESLRDLMPRPAGGSEVQEDTSAVAAFLEVGFEQADAERGAKMLESGIYLGFEDVASSLMLFSDDTRRYARVKGAAAIQETAKRIDAPGTGLSL